MRVILSFLIFILISASALFFLDSFYTVPADSVAVKLRFGKYIEQTNPGFHFKLPLIEVVYIVPVQTQLKEEFGFRTKKAGKRTVFENKDYSKEALMLTGDLNVVHLEWSTQYKISDPYKFLFSTREPIQTFRDLNEAVIRAIAGSYDTTYILTVGRRQIALEAKEELQKLSNDYELGLSVDQVILQAVEPPKEVAAAFNEVNRAQQQMKKTINEAWAKYNKIIPRVKGEAAKMISEAEGYAAQRVNEALGDVAYFNSLASAYREYPDITMKRLYLETMLKILPLTDKTILDSEVKSILPTLKIGGK